MIDYEEEWILPLLIHRSGSVFCKASCFAIPSTILTVVLLFLQDLYPEFRENNHLNDLSGSAFWNAFAAGLLFMISFRTNRAINRFWEGTGLLHQMRGEWFDTVSNCVSFSIHAKKGNKIADVNYFRHTLVRLMSLCHGNALEEISGNDFELETIDVMGIDKDTLKYLKVCHEDHGFNKVEMCLHLIQTLITSAFHQDLLSMPAPIVSRVYQTISRGFVNLLNTKKITDTKFPFPYAQLIAFGLFLFTFITPALFSSLIVHKSFAAIATFTPVFVLAGLNYTAMELENPFGKDPNDLPLKHFQWEMDNCLLMLLHPHADTVPTIGATAEIDFHKLLIRFQDAHNDTGEGADDEVNKPNYRRFATQRLDATAVTDAQLDETVGSTDADEHEGMTKTTQESKADVASHPNEKPSQTKAANNQHPACSEQDRLQSDDQHPAFQALEDQLRLDGSIHKIVGSPTTKPVLWTQAGEDNLNDKMTKDSSRKKKHLHADAKHLHAEAPRNSSPSGESAASATSVSASHQPSEQLKPHGSTLDVGVPHDGYRDSFTDQPELNLEIHVGRPASKPVFWPKPEACFQQC